MQLCAQAPRGLLRRTERRSRAQGTGRAHCLSPREELIAELTILLEDDKNPEF